MPTERDRLFEKTFKTHFEELYRYAFKILKDSNIAEETVQQVFLKLWEKGSQENIHTSIRSYLYRAVYNESLNSIKKEQYRIEHQAYQQHTIGKENTTQQNDKELRDRLHIALSKLPEKSRTIFEMSRFQELKYQEIAQELGVSIKTIEGQMTKVLKHLRVHLAEYLNILTLIMMTTEL